MHRKRRLHARRLLCRGEIDRHDARVRMRRAQDASVQHARAVDVVGVLGAARSPSAAPSRRVMRAGQDGESSGAPATDTSRAAVGRAGAWTSGTWGSATGHPLRRSQHRLEHARVGAAAADVAVERRASPARASGSDVFSSSADGRHHEAGRAEAAHRAVVLAEAPAARDAARCRRSGPRWCGCPCPGPRSPAWSTSRPSAPSTITVQAPQVPRSQTRFSR